MPKISISSPGDYRFCYYRDVAALKSTDVPGIESSAELQKGRSIRNGVYFEPGKETGGTRDVYSEQRRNRRESASERCRILFSR